MPSRPVVPLQGYLAKIEKASKIDKNGTIMV
jgi:hypothetical protein